MRLGPVVSAGIMLGAGLGGFFDGIVFHQILQWHNMISSMRPPTDLVAMKQNMLWDGVFHAFTWLLTSAGLVRLWFAVRETNVKIPHLAVGGGFLIGWGLFNVVEGLVDHHITGIHHVHPGTAQLAWDLAFLAWGVLMLVAGLAAVQKVRGSHGLRQGKPNAHEASRQWDEIDEASYHSFPASDPPAGWAGRDIPRAGRSSP